MKITENIELLNCDCMEYMRTFKKAVERLKQHIRQQKLF